MSRQIEMPINNNISATSRSLKKKHPNNQNLYQDDREFLELLREVKIRFDTNPKFYQKEDYQKLIELCRKNGEGAYDIATEEDVEQVIGLLPEMVTDICDGDNLDYSMFTGNSKYTPMEQEDVHQIIENIFNN